MFTLLREKKIEKISASDTPYILVILATKQNVV
ncbi:MAG: hypothetical protein Satyrvirus22_12 [Satyrvirus sp.]|uniref:Uncharacterized protein n=1 Tax=Satyrvirus sp. TaxID=2487771 RepID=A0A3G5AEI8_9VIRU|nr:MAG: hypothetical protein Satyrvirus22_12 [Satyrvirus sp.]